VYGPETTLAEEDGLEPISYIGALQSTLVHVTVYVLHSSLHVLVQIANQKGLRKNSIYHTHCGMRTRC
jgi:hypothetical protein